MRIVEFIVDFPVPLIQVQIVELVTVVPLERVVRRASDPLLRSWRESWKSFTSFDRCVFPSALASKSPPFPCHSVLHKPSKWRPSLLSACLGAQESVSWTCPYLR